MSGFITRLWSVAAALLLLTSLGSACNDSELNPLVPDIFSPQAEDGISFGTVTVGTVSQQPFELHNVGGGTLDIASVTLADGTGPFSVVDYSGAVVPHTLVELQVNFEPVDLGPAQDIILVESNDPDEPMLEIPVFALDVVEGPIPDIAWSPPALDWGPVPTNGQVIKSVQLSSVGTGDLEVADIYIATGSSEDFSLMSNPAPITLPPSYTTQIDVAYAPSDAAPDAGTLVVVSNDPDTPEVLIPLTGELMPAPDIELVPTQLLFGQVDIGVTVTMDAEVWSLGDADLELGSLSLNASNEFVIEVDPSNAVLVPGDHTTITVSYTPTDLVPDTGEVVIPSNDPDENPAYLLLAGQHTPIPDIEVTPLFIDFGTVDVGSSDAESVLVSNVGTGDLTVDMPILTGASEFSISAASFPAVIPPGSTEIILVTYSPTDLNPDTGEIAINSDDPDEPTVIVDLIGDATPAPDIDLTPTTLNFGAVQVGNNLEMSATISNVGTADLNLGSMTVIGTTEFTITLDPSGQTLVPWDSTLISVTYAPIDSGSDNAMVEIPSNDPDENPIYLNLVGAEDPVPDILVDPVYHDFGDVDINTTSTTQVLVSNIGGADLDVTNLSLTGSIDFSYISNNLPGIIPPGGSQIVHVTYGPTDQVADTGTLTVFSNDPDEPSVDVQLLGGPSQYPDIDVDPWTYDFGDVKVGDVASGWITIYNVGTADLDLTQASPAGSPTFSIASNPAPAIIPPGGSVQMGVDFAPTMETVYTGFVDLFSNDPDEPIVTVDLLGAGATPQIEIDPPHFNFGALGIGCDDNVDIAIRNIGNAELELYGYTFNVNPTPTMSIDATALQTAISMGTPLQPGQEIWVNVEFIPDDVASYTGFLTVSSDDPQVPNALGDQVGDGTPGGNTSEQWLQQGNNWTDIMWVVDNSCSMSEEQTTLGDDFNAFYNIINGAGVDYRIAVVTTDNANFQGVTKVINPSTPNGAATFASNCSVGTNGSATERGLMYGWNGLSMAINNTSPNQNFYRQDAGLRMVFVSDENDQSGTWSTYVSNYQSTKANPDHVILSAIVGTDGYNATSCSGAGGNAGAGTGYVEAVNATGGVLGSICNSSWSTVLQNLGWISVNLADTFTLSQVPIPNTIDVYVNGTPIYNGWYWDAGLNAVVFLPNYVPANGDTVLIGYSYYGSC